MDACEKFEFIYVKTFVFHQWKKSLSQKNVHKM